MYNTGVRAGFLDFFQESKASEFLVKTICIAVELTGSKGRQVWQIDYRHGGL